MPSDQTKGIFINVVEIVDACTRALALAKTNNDETLEAAAKSVMSAAVFHLGKRYADIPVALRTHYDYLLKHV